MTKRKKIAAIQSCYIPWKGYFDIINLVDEFILLDDTQYTRRDWRNRNKIKSSKGSEWLSIPVTVKGKYYQKINETIINDVDWAKKHWRTITTNYSNSPYFKNYKDLFEEFYINTDEIYLSKVNLQLIKIIMKILNIETNIRWSTDYSCSDEKNRRLIELCLFAGGGEYLSGPSAKNYIDEQQFNEENITVSWMDYSGYQPYHQLYGAFDHYVSIIDLIFNEGPNAPKFMKSFA